MFSEPISLGSGIILGFVLLMVFILGLLIGYMIRKRMK